MISNKRNFKLFRLIICLVVAVAASSMFLTVEPMASENANPEVVAVQEDVVEVQTLRAYSTGIPVTPLRLALQPLNTNQTVDAVSIEAAIASLPETETEEELTDPIEEDIEEEPSYDYEEDVYYEESEVIEEEEDYEEEESSEYVEDSTEYEEESSEYEEESSEIEEEDSTPVEPEEEPEVKENEEVSVPEVSAPGTYSDLDYLAAICQIEAGYNYDGCLAVANVILNRVNAGFGSSIYDVIYAPYQFATGWMDYWLENGTSAEAREAAAAAMAGSNNVGGYLYFNGTTWLDPESLDCPYVVIGGNVFY